MNTIYVERFQYDRDNPQAGSLDLFVECVQRGNFTVEQFERLFPSEFQEVKVFLSSPVSDTPDKSTS